MKKPYIISDIALNHNGDYKRACDSVFQARQCGFDAVKFQLYDTERLTEDSETRKLLRAGKFDPEWLPGLRGLCDDLKIDLAVTPFYPEAVEIIKPYVDWIKIGSYEIGYLNLIEKIKESNKPVIISTGMVESVDDVMDVFYYLADSQIKTLLYCVSKYPCKPEDIDMSWIIGTKDDMGYPIGYSDHSHDPNVIWAALMAGAEYIEMHFDIDGEGLEYSMGHVWTARECYAMIHNIKSAVKCFETTDFVPVFSKRTNQDGRRR